MSETLYGQIKEVVFGIKNPPKTISVRLPTDAEWLKRMKSQKMIRRELGNRKSQSEFIPNPDADLALLKSITTNIEGEPADTDEAQHIIGILSTAKVANSGRCGDGYFVDIAWRLPGGISGETRHIVEIPKVGQISEYKSKVVKVFDLPHGMSEIKFNTDAAIEFYDAIIQQTTGYTDDVKPPAIHKQPVISEVVQLFDTEIAEGDLGF